MAEKRSNLIKNIIIAFILFLVIAGIFSLYNSPFEEKQKISISNLVERINKGEVNKILVEDNKLEVDLKDNTKVEAQKEAETSLTESLKNYSVKPEELGKVNLEIKDASRGTFWINTVLPLAIPFLLIGGFIWFMMRSVQAGSNKALSFGESQARQTMPDKRKRITFGDVAGAKEAKEELKEVIDFLKNPLKFIKLGARVPKGVLLMGLPGTGKTLLARAVAGEANVPFFHISGSEFVEMFVGVGASRVRDLFKKAKKNTPCIVFIDEIDAVGRQRGTGLGGSHDEREQTLNQILVEMDGFDTDTNIIVIAATNRPDVLDPALLRPGRFDRRIILDLPDIKEREAILKVHSRNKPLGRDINLKVMAQRTPGFSGADLANAINEAAILAARRNKKTVGQKESLESIEKVLLGPERKSHILTEKEKKIAAYHEAGHALAVHLLPHTDPVHKISIVSRGRAAGYTLKLPEEDKKMHSKSEFLDDIVVLLAGYTAEKEVFGDLTTGATNDLREATELSRKLVTEYGMSDKLGPMTFGEKEELIFLGREIGEQRNYSEEVAAKIDEEVFSIIEKSHQEAKRVIIQNRDKLEKIAKRLIEKETIERDEFEKMMGKKKTQNSNVKAQNYNLNLKSNKF